MPCPCLEADELVRTVYGWCTQGEGRDDVAVVKDQDPKPKLTAKAPKASTAAKPAKKKEVAGKPSKKRKVRGGWGDTPISSWLAMRAGTATVGLQLSAGHPTC